MRGVVIPPAERHHVLNACDFELCFQVRIEQSQAVEHIVPYKNPLHPLCPKPLNDLDEMIHVEVVNTLPGDPALRTLARVPRLVHAHVEGGDPVGPGVPFNDFVVEIEQHFISLWTLCAEAVSNGTAVAVLH